MSKSKQEEYTIKILEQLQGLFEEGNAHIDIKELEDNGNAADFFHALANLAPAIVYTKLTQKEVGTLDFNHIANRLCFQNVVLKSDTLTDHRQTNESAHQQITQP